MNANVNMNMNKMNILYWLHIVVHMMSSYDIAAYLVINTTTEIGYAVTVMMRIGCNSGRTYVTYMSLSFCIALVHTM